ncbi:MAG: CDP-alcohol phosphatidyltransferase family protein [Myxococcales bacterium]|nr:CDP-alcohol phosphatidyltransferase family protein [Myxococcales bacterium]
MPVEYSVEDRSILLPWYKKAVVDPVVRRLPATLHPNTITHAGHLLNLLGLAAVIAVHPRGPSAVYVIPAITLHLYNLCDNADGAHARRTKQTSPLGELLDHGLDLLNVAYIAALSALAIGASPLGSVAMVAAVTGAAAAVYWEQAETGVFQLGLLNQVEATFVLSGVLVTAAIVGPEAIGAVHVGPIALRDGVAFTVVVGAIAGVLHGGLRVHRRRGNLAPFVTLVAFGLTAVLAVATSTLGWPIGAALAATGYVFLGIRSLTLRMRGRKPLRETGVLVLVAVLGACIVWGKTGADVARVASVASVAGALALLALSLVHARRGLAAATGRS